MIWRDEEYPDHSLFEKDKIEFRLEPGTQTEESSLGKKGRQTSQPSEGFASLRPSQFYPSFYPPPLPEHFDGAAENAFGPALIPYDPPVPVNEPLLQRENSTRERRRRNENAAPEQTRDERRAARNLRSTQNLRPPDRLTYP